MNRTEIRYLKEQELLMQAHETINTMSNARHSNDYALAELRYRLVDAIDSILIEDGTAVELNPPIGIVLMNSALGEEPHNELRYTKMSSVAFDMNTGQTQIAEYDIAFDENIQCYEYTTDNLDIQDLTILLDYLVNSSRHQ